MAFDHIYRYLDASHFDRDKRSLRLATCNQNIDEHPYFFSGSLVRPQRTAKLLLGLMSTVHARYHIPAVMLERILILSDPVVTSSDERLRFEGFSNCCGVYVRLDLYPESLKGKRFGRGSTNVDFNQPMLSALSMVRDTDEVSMSIGSDRVEVSKNDETVVEKKVKLPFRWLKGFVEVQACQCRMQKMLDTSGPKAARFFKSLPRMKTSRRETWIVGSRSGLRISQVKPRDSGIRVGGLERLRVLERFAAQAETLNIYADETTGATGWELVFDDCRFHLVLSPEVWRGFSGEGQALESLGNKKWQNALPAIRAQLNWQSVIDICDIAARADVARNIAEDTLSVLGVQGLVGYDLGESAYFHRQLPFDLSNVDMTQPRLRSARKLVDTQKVGIISQTENEIVATVQSIDVQHRVRISSDQTKCTCPWYAKHRSNRGPCKHILSVQLSLTEEK
ncbi:SWIM zinc finger family protein [candidate division CSSED10-310 bacterium]|uniref:SWIM zinc finger family protein n=1 Tax=candidate division CSSED10-310 bacterium TaxID=2855610 RepID=A0ABV6YTI4_UNCC1